MDNLEKDVREAMRLGYGIHYGNYKVDHPHTRDDLDMPPPPKHPPKKCPECGIEFIPERANQKYCSADCQQNRQRLDKEKYKRRKQLNLPLGPAVCLVCGGNYVRYKKTQETCSRSCAARVRNLRRYDQNTNINMSPGQEGNS